VSVVVIGLNHRTVPLALLERVAVPEERLVKALHDLVHRANVSEAVLVSTCNRTEVYVWAERFHGAYQDVGEFLAGVAGLSVEDFGDHLYSYFEEGAAEHLFSVAAGLDSAVLGESEILGQVRDAWEVAREEGTSRSGLNLLFRHALEVGKRARTETAIGRHATSVSQAAVAMARERLGSLAGRRVLVVGAGDMGEGMAATLAGAGCAQVVVANRTPERAEEVASRVHGQAVSLGEIRELLRDVDLVLTSTGSPLPVIERDDVDDAFAHRRGRPLLFIDMAVPRDVERSVAEVEGVTLLDLDDLRAFAARGVAERQREVADVREIVAVEVRRYRDGALARSVSPLVAELHGRAEAARVTELERFAARLEGLDERQREAVEALTHGLVAKLLHQPTVRLKDVAGTPRGERLADALRDLFDLEP